MLCLCEAFPSLLLATSTPYNFTTFAGVAGVSGSDDSQKIQPTFNQPGGVAIDSLGNLYVADSDNNTIRKITQAGVVTTIAGKAGTKGSSDGTGDQASFNKPQEVAVDSKGNLYVADSDNNTIRKITQAGVVTTIAGKAGTKGSSDGTGDQARFSYPGGVAVDSKGNVYVADYLNHTIRKITSSGVVTTLAGQVNVLGSSDGTGNQASFFYPWGVAVDSKGNVYVTELLNYTIRKITPSGVVTTLAGQVGVYGSSDGTGNQASFNGPLGVAVDLKGNLYVTDSENYTIRKITPAGHVATIAGVATVSGSSDGTGPYARFSYPYGVALDLKGNVYVTDAIDNTIRKITPAKTTFSGQEEGVVTTFVGQVGVTGSDDCEKPARLNNPCGVAVDSKGNSYVADSLNNTIRKITPSGVVTTFAGQTGVQGSADGTGTQARFNQPFGVAVDSKGTVYVTDNGNETIRKITPAGVVTTLAGRAGNYGYSDGRGSSASFFAPCGVAVDLKGNVYVSDSYNDSIRKITPAGVVTTLAGDPSTSGSADGTGKKASFATPAGVAVDLKGNVYVANTGDETIRKITPAGVVSTLAGQAGVGGSADGTGSQSKFHTPFGVAVDSKGNVYVADTGNNALREITPARVVTTLSGQGQTSFNQPEGVAVDSLGNVYVADTYNNIIRKGSAQ